MSRNILAGIDVGTYEIKVVICEAGTNEEKNLPRLLGLGTSESRGLRRGYIINQNDVTKSVGIALRQAEKNAGTKVKKAYISLGGIGLQSITSTGSAMISRADSEITDLDVSKAIINSEKEIPKQFSLNRKVVHTIPIQFKIDGKTVYSRPHGMKAMKLEAKTLFITCLEQHMNDLIQCIEELNIEVEDVIASPIAASLVAVSKVQKVAGCIIANIGAETVSVIVFENNIPISLEVFPIGGTDITHDIALGLKIALESAENIKRGEWDNGSYSKKKIDEIISARLSDIFEAIDLHLKRISRSGLLPAGIILIGGGSQGVGISEFARDALKLPSKISSLELAGTVKSHKKSVVWMSAYGLCLVGLADGEENDMGMQRELKVAKSTTKKLMRRLVAWAKQFLP